MEKLAKDLTCHITNGQHGCQNTLNSDLKTKCYFTSVRIAILNRQTIPTDKQTGNSNSYVTGMRNIGITALDKLCANIFQNLIESHSITLDEIKQNTEL